MLWDVVVLEYKFIGSQYSGDIDNFNYFCYSLGGLC